MTGLEAICSNGNIQDRLNFESRKNELLLGLSSLIMDSEKTVFDLLKYVVDGIPQLGKKLNARFYQVVGIDNDIREIIMNREDLEDYRNEYALHWLYDTRTNPENADGSERYIAICPDTTTGISVLTQTPTVATSKLPSDSEKIADFIYSTKLGTGRFEPFIANRASFPIKNIESGEIEYVVVLDKLHESEGKKIDDPFLEYELRFVNDFINIVQPYMAHKRHQQRIADARHDLVTPLTAIRGMLGRVLNSVEKGNTDGLKEASARYKLLAKSTGEQLNMLMDQLKDGEYKMRVAPFCLDQLIEENYSSESIDLSNSINQQLKINYAANLDANRCTVLGDESYLSRSINNMIRNSIQNCDKDNLNISISTEIVRDSGGKGQLIFTYVDDAGGMDKTTEEKVWNTNELYTTKEGEGGRGINMIKSYFKEMGWKIDLINTPGKGIKYVAKMPIN